MVGSIPNDDAFMIFCVMSPHGYPIFVLGKTGDIRHGGKTFLEVRSAHHGDLVDEISQKIQVATEFVPFGLEFWHKIDVVAEHIPKNVILRCFHGILDKLLFGGWGKTLNQTFKWIIEVRCAGVMDGQFVWIEGCKSAVCIQKLVNNFGLDLLFIHAGFFMFVLDSVPSFPWGKDNSLSDNISWAGYFKMLVACTTLRLMPGMGKGRMLRGRLPEWAIENNWTSSETRLLK